MERKVKVSIPASILKKIKEKIKNSRFKTPDEYIEYILKEVLEGGEKVYTKEQEREVKERLKALGYFE